MSNTVIFTYLNGLKTVYKLNPTLICHKLYFCFSRNTTDELEGKDLSLSRSFKRKIVAKAKMRVPPLPPKKDKNGRRHVVHKGKMRVPPLPPKKGI